MGEMGEIGRWGDGEDGEMRKMGEMEKIAITEVTQPTKETGFFDENTSFLPIDSLKNPVSGTPYVSPKLAISH